MERYRLRSALVFVFYKTSFTLGLLAGLSFAVPLLCGMYIGAEYQLLTLPLVFVALIAGTILCGGWAERKLQRMNDILYVDCDPDRFLELFSKEIYSRKSENWRGLVLLFIAQAYHAQGRFKEEEALYLRFLNNTRRKNPDDTEDLEVLARLTILYGDAQNAAGAQKAFKKFREMAQALPPAPEGQTRTAYDELKDFVYNSYLMGIGKPDECVGFFEWHCQNRPNELCALLSHYRLAEVYRALGSSDEAEREYRTVADSGKNIYAVRMAKQRLTEYK